MLGALVTEQNDDRFYKRRCKNLPDLASTAPDEDARCSETTGDENRACRAMRGRQDGRLYGDGAGATVYIPAARRRRFLHDSGESFCARRYVVIFGQLHQNNYAVDGSHCPQAVRRGFRHSVPYAHREPDSCGGEGVESG